MTTTKHTPGPWTTDGEEHDCRIEVCAHVSRPGRPGNEVLICQVCVDDGYVDSAGRANARLIAAAPALLAALEDICDNGLSSGWWATARAAIAAARGRG